MIGATHQSRRGILKFATVENMGRIDGLSNDCRLGGYNFELASRRVAFPNCKTYSNECQIDTCIATAPNLAQLRPLAWSETADAGVFARHFKLNGKGVSIRKTGDLYIRSASNILVVWPLGDVGCCYRRLEHKMRHQELSLALHLSILVMQHLHQVSIRR
jgi:hypothetical protein